MTGTVEQIVRLNKRSLAFQSFNRESADWTIGVVSTVTGGLRKLKRHPFQVSDPNDPDVVCRMITWTADGQSIVYARAVTGQLDYTVFRVPAPRAVRLS